jgi:hypothetical protein
MKTFIEKANQIIGYDNFLKECLRTAEQIERVESKSDLIKLKDLYARLSTANVADNDENLHVGIIDTENRTVEVSSLVCVRFAASMLIDGLVFDNLTSEQINQRTERMTTEVRELLPFWGYQGSKGTSVSEKIRTNTIKTFARYLYAVAVIRNDELQSDEIEKEMLLHELASQKIILPNSVLFATSSFPEDPKAYEAIHNLRMKDVRKHENRFGKISNKLIEESVQSLEKEIKKRFDSESEPLISWMQYKRFAANLIWIIGEPFQKKYGIKVNPDTKVISTCSTNEELTNTFLLSLMANVNADIGETLALRYRLKQFKHNQQ